MCGILGYLINEKNEASEPMLNAIEHRGPDDKGAFENDKIFLGQTRLSIQDLSENGHQPMFSSDGNYVLIFNGEIYNHWEVRNKIESKYSFNSTSDSETLLYGFMEYGPEVLNQLNGIFAFAIYNIKEQKLFVARDQVGVKPLYYYLKGEDFMFGSELKSFLSHSGFDFQLRLESLFSYTNLLWSPGSNTPFTHVKKLLPGHYIEVDLKSKTVPAISKYYDIPFTGSYSDKSEQELIDALDNQLNNAVKRQLLSDVPVGFFLSGGLDSSLLVAIAKKYSTDKLQTFTINSPDIESEGFSDDLYYAKLVAKHLDVALEVVDADVDIVKDFDNMIWHLDEPQADAAPLNVSNICAQAKKMGYKVLIGGAGGDDLFSGYRRHQALKYSKTFSRIPRPLRVLINSIAQKIGPSNSKLRRIAKGLNNIDKSNLERMAGYFSWISDKRNRKLFVDEDATSWNAPTNYLLKILNNIPSEINELNQMLYWEMKTFLVDHNLNYTDKMSMAHGVEARVPFLDLELVKFSTSIPPELKLKNSETKYLLKKVAERYLPHEVIYRPKTGFGAPVRKWITEDLNDLLQNYLSKDQINKRKIFNADEVWNLIEDNKKSKIDASYTIWCLLAIESWYRQFIDPYYNKTN